MAKKDNEFGNAVLGGFTRAFIQHIALTYFIPIATPAIVALIGFWTGLPWFWIIIGSLAAFAFIATGLVRFQEWIAARGVKGKLIFSQAEVGIDGDNPERIITGFWVVSQASFEIEFEIVKLSTRIGDRVPPDKPYQSPTNIIVPPNGRGWFWDHGISVPYSERRGTVLAILELTLRYGRPGDLKYELKTKKQINIRFDESGAFVGVTWFNIAT